MVPSPVISYAEFRAIRAAKRATRTLYRAGDPSTTFPELPMEVAVVRTATAAALPLHAYDAIVRTDASYLRGKGIQGTAWQLVIRGVEGRIESASKRYSKGPTYAEMMAVGSGLRAAADEALSTVILHTDSQWSAKWILDLVHAQQPHMVEVTQLVARFLSRFSTIAVVHTRTRNIRKVDEAARKAARREETRVSGVEQSKAMKVAAKINLARQVTLTRDGLVYTCNGYIRTQFDPPSCTCKGWTLRWSTVPLVGKRSRRLPCVHLIAVALSEGVIDPSAIAQLGRKAVI